MAYHIYPNTPIAAGEEVKEINREDCSDLLQAEVSRLRSEVGELGLKLEKLNNKLDKKKNELENERKNSNTLRQFIQDLNNKVQLLERSPPPPQVNPSIQSVHIPGMHPVVSEEMVQRVVMDKTGLENLVCKQKREIELLKCKLTQNTDAHQHSLLLREQQLEECKSNYLKLQEECQLGKQLFQKALSSLSAENETLRRQDTNIVEKLLSEKSGLEQRIKQTNLANEEKFKMETLENIDTPTLDHYSRNRYYYPTCPLIRPPIAPHMGPPGVPTRPPIAPHMVPPGVPTRPPIAPHMGPPIRHRGGSYEQPWKCSFCGSVYPTERDRDIHMTDSCPSSPMVLRDDTVLNAPARRATFQKRHTIHSPCDTIFYPHSDTMPPVQGYGYPNNPTQTQPLLQNQPRGYQMRPSYPGHPPDPQAQNIGGPIRGIVPNLPNPLRRPGDIVPVPLSPTHRPGMVRPPSGPKPICEEPQMPLAKVQSPLSFPGESRVKVVLVWSKERPTLEREITFFDCGSQDPLTLLWSEDKALYQGNGSLNVGTHSGTLLFPTTGEMQPVQKFDVVRKQMGMGMIKLKLHELCAQGEPANQIDEQNINNLTKKCKELEKQLSELKNGNRKLEMKGEDTSEHSHQLIGQLMNELDTLKDELKNEKQRQLDELERDRIETELKLGDMVTEISNRDGRIHELEQNVGMLQNKSPVAQTTYTPLMPKTKVDKNNTKLSKDQTKQKQPEFLPLYEELTPQIVPVVNKSGKSPFKISIKPGMSVNVVKLKSLPNPLEYQGTQVIQPVNKQYELGVLVIIIDTQSRVGLRTGVQKYVGIKLNKPCGEF